MAQGCPSECSALLGLSALKQGAQLPRALALPPPPAAAQCLELAPLSPRAKFSHERKCFNRDFPPVALCEATGATQHPPCFWLPTGRDLSVDITAAEHSLSEGDTLQLNCVVGAPKSSSRHFEVIWLLDSVEVARVDPHRVLIWKEDYEERAKLGQLRAFKPSNAIYVLTIYEVGLKDKGTYQCSVMEMKTPGDSHSIQTNVSAGLQVNVKPAGQ